MKRFNRLFALLVVMVLCASAIPIRAQGGPQPVGIRLDAPPYAKHGPFWVGEREFTFMNGDRKIEVAVWYPALNPAGIPESITYRYDIPAIGGVGEIPGHAIGNALPDSSGGPYPLIVFSHGLGLHPFSALMFTEHWASYGFVVMAIDHQESDTRAWFSDLKATGANVPKDMFRRIEDVKSALAFAEKLTAEDGTLAGMIDAERLAMTGFVVGSVTALTFGGARFDPDGFAEYCKRADVIRGLTSGGFDVICTEPALNEFYTLGSVKPGSGELVPTNKDPRVAAVIALGNDSFLISKTSMAEMKVPVLFASGTRQLTPVPDADASARYKRLANAPKTAITFRDADDQVFRYDCNNTLDKAWGAASYAFCSDAVWDFARVHDLTNHFTTAFLLDVLKGDAEAHKALLPEAVTFPGITYETTLK